MSELKGVAQAILTAQKNLADAKKGADNPFFKSKYADLNAIREACLPACHDAGLAVLQPTVFINGIKYVKTTLLHGETGQHYPFPGDDPCLTEILSNKPNDPQAQGSAISYARRYGLQSLLNIGAVDDDSETAMNRNPSSNKTNPEKSEEVKAKSAAPKFEIKKPSPTKAVANDEL